jgi:two-component system NtrC family sensor kinase
MKLVPYLNIRQKVVVGLALTMAMMAVIAFFSYDYLRQIERKQHFSVIADDLSNMILEIRRYEKNYLLYGAAEDLLETINYIQQSSSLIRKIEADVHGFKAMPLLDHLEQSLEDYRIHIEGLANARSQTDKAVGLQKEEQLRNLGKQIVDLSSRLVSFERTKILIIIKTLKTHLITSSILFMVLGGFLISFVSFKIIRPLRGIEKTMLRIAEGDFRPIPVQDNRDETQRVVQAFNRMVAELETRQDQLVQAKKLTSLGTLTSGIAHQLNNPLNNISTSCQILIEDLDLLLERLDPADREMTSKMLDNIKQEVYRARDIVRGLLEFSREKEFCLAPTSLRQVVERATNLISSQVPPGIQIACNIPDDLSLNMDNQRMQQVFLNLIENAIHAIGDIGEIRITAEKIPSQDQVVISVEDTGSGISDKDLASIFDPFYTTKEVGWGTGLGLSIVYGIVQKHNGLIDVQSIMGEGTRFNIRLPLIRVC